MRTNQHTFPAQGRTTSDTFQAWAQQYFVPNVKLHLFLEALHLSWWLANLVSDFSAHPDLFGRTVAVSTF